MNLEIRQVADPIYANARGAAWIGAVGLGEISFGDVPNLVEISRIFTPQEANRTLYDGRFDVFMQIYKRMRPVYKRLNE
jgi:xylulokinase